MAFDPLVTPIDYVLFNGKPTPGIAVLDGASQPMKWDELVGYGWSGSFAIFKGQRLSKFKIFLDLVTADHWQEWESFAATISKPVAGQRPKSISMWHPWLVTLGIKAGVILDISQPQEQDLGIWRVTLEILEFRAPKRTLAKPDSAATQDGKPQSAAEAAFVNAAKATSAKLQELGS